jgi:class 3 adenylate cyclase
LAGGSATEMEAALAPYVPELLRRWPEGLAWQQLEGTMVSADISGFTTLAERLAERGREGAEELNALICGCFEGMIEHCDRQGGDVIKFGGDALLVWFAGDGHATRACRAAVGMRRTIRRRRTTSDGRLVRLAMSIGVHSGQHQFFAIHAGCDDLIVSGPGATATVAAESAAAAGEILLSDATARLVPASWLGAARPESVTLQRLTAGHRRPPPPTETTPTTRPSSTFISEVQQAQVLAGAVYEHRQVAVSFVAFGGTDALIASGGAGELAERLRAASASIASIGERYGVFLLATDVNRDGGKFMLAAGAPLSRGGDDERMLRAAREIVDADPGIGLRAGVTRGYVFGCDLGSDRRRVYTVMGDAVNLSARLMSRAAPGEIIVSRPVMEWASSRFEYDALEPFLVKGKTVPIYAGRLGRHLGGRTELDQVDTELCGRTSELTTLLGLADAAAEGHASVVVITGEAGIGKSRLAVEVVRRRLDFVVVFARCQPFDRLSAYSVAMPILRPSSCSRPTSDRPGACAPSATSPARSRRRSR